MVALFISCSTNDAINEESPETASLNMYDKTYIENAPLTEQLEYKRFHFKKLTIWLLKNNVEVKNTILNIKRNNNDISTFFIESIINEVTQKRAIQKEEMEKLNLSLRAFENLDGESVYPAIYFSNFENYQNRDPYDDTKPLYALDDYDEVAQEQIMVGYQENETGDLVEIEETLTPALEGEVDINAIKYNFNFLVP